MPALLPFLDALVLYLYFARRVSWREAWVHATVVWALQLTLITEVLSVFHLVTPVGIATGWTVAIAVALALLARAAAAPAAVAASVGPIEKALIGGAALVVAAVALVAVVTPPNVPDVFVYHMTRVVVWAQQRSVEFFSTWSPQQLFQPPWSEYGMLHLFSLARSDRWVNLIQVFAFAGSAIVASLLARDLGARTSGQVLAAVLVVTTPEVVLQASNAKNDCVVAYWTVAFAFYLWRCAGAWRWPDVVGAGAALGLMLLTKGVGYIVAAALAVGIAALLTRTGWRLALRRAPLLVLVAVLVNAGHYARNWQAFGSPLGCTSAECGGAYKFTNDDHSPAAIAANVARNIGIHLFTPFAAWNQVVYGAVDKTVRAVGRTLDDPPTTWRDTTFAIEVPSRNEHTQGNPLQIVLVTVCLGLVVARFARYRGSPRLVVFGASVLGAFLLFCFVLRWQPWHTRLQIPLFVLWCPFVAVVIEREKAAWIAPLGTLLLMLAWPFALQNEMRPLVGVTKMWDRSILATSRAAMYDVYHGGDFASGRAVAAKLEAWGCREVAVLGTFDYRLLAGLGLGVRDLRLVYVGGETPTVRRPVGENLCAILCKDCRPARAATFKALGSDSEAVGGYLLVMGVKADWAPPDTWVDRR